MSILIKGMKMPKGCLECPFKDIGMSAMTQCLLVAGWVEYANDGYGIPDACPLVELPEKHGRLIDTDDVKSRMIPLSFSVQKWIGDVELSFCKTVIEAEGDEE